MKAQFTKKKISLEIFYYLMTGGKLNQTQIKEVQVPYCFSRDRISSLVQDWTYFVSPLLTKVTFS